VNADGQPCDLPFIDGKGRVACLDPSLPSLNFGGLPFIDNTERMENRYAAMWSGLSEDDRDHSGATENYRWVTTGTWRRQEAALTTQGKLLGSQRETEGTKTMNMPENPADENSESEPSIIEDILDEDLGGVSGGNRRGY
jgi:hypothetical protein